MTTVKRCWATGIENSEDLKIITLCCRKERVSAFGSAKAIARRKGVTGTIELSLKREK